jgi:hypothetical protein
MNDPLAASLEKADPQGMIGQKAALSKGCPFERLPLQKTGMDISL